MSSGAKSTLLLGLLVLSISTMSCGTDTPLSEYVPSSDQESAIKSVLVDFQESVNRRDPQNVANLLHEDATIMLGRERRRLSKSEYIEILPQRLANQPPIALGRPKMDMKGDTANNRYFLPCTPIEVSPLTMRGFLSQRGLIVMKSEILWIWVPLVSVGIMGWIARSLKPRPSDRKK